MWLFNKCVERRIQAAADRGELDNLPGQGQPLDLDDDSGIPEDMRMAMRVLKNAGYVPEGVSIRQDIAGLEARLAAVEPHSREHCQAHRRLSFLRLRLEISGGSEAGPLFGVGEYREKLLGQMLHSDSAGPD